jgi:hypothetical protein
LAPRLVEQKWTRAFEQHNGAGNRDELPVPPTFMLDRTGIVTWRFLEAGYWERAEPNDVLEALRRSNTKK